MWAWSTRLVRRAGLAAPLVDALEADEALGAVSPRMLFADRFVDVGISSPRLSPAPPIAGRWACRSAAPGSTVSTGGGMPSSPREPGASSTTPPGVGSRTSGTAVVRLPAGLAHPGARQPPAAGPRQGGDVRTPQAALRLAAEGPKRITLRCGTVERHVDVGAPLRGSRSRSPEPRDIVNNVGSIVFEDGYGADRGFLEPDEGQYQEPVEVFAWCGGSVLLRPRYLADVGLFDERFFLYYEDTDLSRARAHAAGATDTCPTPWCAMCTPHRRARGRRCSSTTSSATGC